MRIDRDLVRKILVDLRRRDERFKGRQPEMIYDCYLGKMRGDTELCESCRNYDICKGYLKAVELRMLLFRT